MKKQLIAEKSYTTHPNHAPIDILQNSDNTEKFIEDYKKVYSNRIWETIKLTKDFQKFEWEIDIKFMHNADELLLAHIMEEDINPYYGFKICIKQYMKSEKIKIGRTKKKGMINSLFAKMRTKRRKSSRRQRID